MSDGSNSHEMDDENSDELARDAGVAATGGVTSAYSELNPDDVWAGKANLAGKAFGHANNAYNLGTEIAEGDLSGIATEASVIGCTAAGVATSVSWGAGTFNPVSGSLIAGLGSGASAVGCYLGSEAIDLDQKFEDFGAYLGKQGVQGANVPAFDGLSRTKELLDEYSLSADQAREIVLSERFSTSPVENIGPVDEVQVSSQESSIPLSDASRTSSESNPIDVALLNSGRHAAHLASDPEYDLTLEEASVEVAHERYTTNPVENFGEREALDGGGTEWPSGEDQTPLSSRSEGVTSNPENAEAVTQPGGTDKSQSGDSFSEAPVEAALADKNHDHSGDAVAGNSLQESGHSDDSTEADNAGDAISGFGNPRDGSSDFSDTDPNTATLGPEPTYSTGEQALAVGGAAAFGSLLGRRLDLDGTGEQTAFNVLNDTFQSNVAATFDNDAFTEGFDDFGADLVAAELSDSLGFDGSSFGDQLGSALTHQAVTSSINAVFDSSMSFSSSLDAGFSAGNLTHLGMSLAASAISQEMGFGAETSTGATLSTVGSMVGSMFGPIGSFFGSALGSALGDMLAGDPPPPPEAQATLGVDEQGHYYVENATDKHGGNAGSMSVAAQRAADTINDLVDATGGRILNPETLANFTIGYDGDGLYVDDQRFGSGSDAIAHIVEQSLADTPIEGGDVYIKRAIYRSLEDGFDPAGIAEALETAQSYSRYQDQSAQIERLSEGEAVADALAAFETGERTRNVLGPEATLVLDARETVAEAEALGLDWPHRFDTASRLNDALEVAGVDLSGIEITDLQLANLHGELVVAVKDPAHPNAPIRALPHVAVDAYASNFDAAMLYLPDGGDWNLGSLLDLTGVQAGGDAVDVEQALIERYGEGTDAIRMGSAGDDDIAGTNADETLIGWQGSDILRAGAGDDVLIGGAGLDTLAGGEGEDTADYSGSAGGVAVDLATGTGHGGHAEGDTLEDIEHLAGSRHADHLAGDSADNAIAGNAGEDTLHGAAGADTLHGGRGDDRIDGGTGEDTLAGHAGDDTLMGGEGDDHLSGGAGDDHLSGGAGDDRVMGGSGDDLLTGGAGSDLVVAGAGDDTFIATGDGDALVGGEGTDTVAYEHDLADYRVEWINGELHIADPEHIGPGDRLLDIEYLQFGDRTIPVETLKEYLSILDSADEDERQRRTTGIAASTVTAIGDAAAIGLVAGFAKAAIAAEQRRAAFEAEGHQPADIPRDPDDYTPPGAAADSLSALGPTEGDIDLPPDRPDEGDSGGDGSNAGTAPGGGDADTGHAGATAVADPAGFDAPPIVPGTGEEADAGKAEETAEADEPNAEASASPDNAEPYDSDGPYYLGGTPGDDELIDHHGYDRIYARGGDDYVVALDGDDYIEAGDGDDRVLAGAGDDEVYGGLGDDVLIGGADRDSLYGGTGDDRLVFDPHDAVIDGGTGEDIARVADGASITAATRFARIEHIIGGAAADTIGLAGHGAGVTVEGRGGDDTLIGGAGDDRLIGGAGADAFIAGAGDDTIVVDAEDDLGLINGGTGHDTVELNGTFAGAVDLSHLDTGTPGRDDGIEAVRGSAGDDRMAGTFNLDRIEGGAGHDVVTLDEDLRDLVTFDAATGELSGLEWRAGGEALHLTGMNGAAVTLATEEVHFDGHAVYLDGRDNAPITQGETFAGTEDERLHLADSDLTANDFDIDLGDTVELLSVGGIDLALTRALESGYWDESAAPEFLDPASGNFRTATYDSYRTSGPKGENPEIIDFGPRPGDRHDGSSGDDILFGQVLTEYYGSKAFYETEPPSRTFHDSDRLFGHDGDDHFVPGGGADRVVGGAGIDTVDYSRSGVYVEVDLLGNEGHHGHASGDELLGIENVIGSDGDDTLEGDDGDNILQGGRGNDVFAGRGGDDVLIGGNGRWDAAEFSGARDEYEITAHGDYLLVEHLNGGVDGTDRLHGIQELHFADRNVRIRDTRAEHGEIRVTDHGIRFDPDADFNSLGGMQAAFGYEVGKAGGARAAETAHIDIAPVNDSPYLAPGETDYDGQLQMQTYNTTPGAKGGESVWYWTANARGQILGRDLEDAANLTYELVEQTEHGWVEVDADGSFHYRLNVGHEGFSYETEQVEVCSPKEGCTTQTIYHLDPPDDEDISTGEARFDSFVVAITDHGEGDDDPVTVHKTIHIENDKPGGDDGCFPVALDLGDDGLDFRSIDDADLLADVNGDGSDDRMAWIGADDGLLLFDRDGDGTFSHPDEISFVDDHPDARTDMEGLALAFDTNDDGVLDARDEQWDVFHVWQDADGDGVSDAGELRTLGEAGIAAIGVVSDGQQETAADGDVTLFGRSAFVRTDGSSGTAADVAFRVELGTESDPAASPPTNNELAAMLVQRMVQSQAMRGADSPSGEHTPPIDDTSLAGLMAQAEEFEMENVAG